MEQEEINKEIDWLMGSIKRSCTRQSGELILVFIVFILIAVMGTVYYALNSNVDEIKEFAPFLSIALWGILSIVLFNFILHKIFRRKLVSAETPQELLATYDRMWMTECALWIVAGVAISFGVEGGIITKGCFVISMVLMAVANWLSMNNQLRLWVGILLLIAESIFLYFSNIGLIVGLSLLMVMLSIIKGNKSIVGSINEDPDNAELETEQEIRQLRKLVKMQEP